MKKVLTSLLGIVLIATMLIFTVKVNAVGDSVTMGDKVYNKITTLEELTDGNYLIGCEEKNAYLGENNGKIYTSVVAEKSLVLNITKTDSGYTIKDNASGMYVEYHGSSNEAYASASGNIYWNITMSDELFVIENVNVLGRCLQYNSSSPRFACYKGTQKDLTLYKEDTNITLEMYTVTFYDGDEVIYTEEYAEGSNLSNVVAPTKEGYYFMGWYKDANFVNAWDSSVDTVTADTTLYAKWEKIVYYTVTLMDGLDTYDSFEVEAGANIANELTYPTKEGYAFGGWYKDAELTVAWDSSVDTVTADTTLYAKWNELNYTKITSVDELVSAQYYIAVYGEESYITNFDSSGWLRVGNIAYALPITIKNEGDYYSLSYIKNGETMYLGHSSNKASEKDECTGNNYKVSSIDYNSGWVIKFADGYIMQYNDNNGSDGFRTYDSIKSNYKLVDLYKINGTEIEETPVVATKFMESETNASLRLFYDAETLVASDVDLRFGVTLSADAYVEGAKYGVIAMPASLGEITSGIQDYTSVEEYLAANPNCTAIAATNIAKVNESGEADEAGSYYQFAWVINNMEGHYSDGIVAVCYMEYEGKLYFNVVKEESVLTVVDKYLALTGLSEEVLTVLENLKNNQ